MRQALVIILPLATYLIIGLILEFVEYFMEITLQNATHFNSWKVIKVILPAIPATSVITGLLMNGRKKNDSKL